MSNLRSKNNIRNILKLINTILILFLSFISFAEPVTSQGIEEKSIACSCNSEPERYCQLNDKEFFYGSCAGPNKRIFGKTYNSNGSIFEGSYTEGNNYKFGTLEWSDGNTITGEFGASPENYNYPEGLEPNRHVIIGEYLLGTITSRGFFILGEDGFLELTTFGTKFNTNPDDRWSYQASFFDGDEPKGETLLTFSVDDYNFAMWFDVNQGQEARVYVEDNGNKSVIDSDGETISDEWDDVALKEVNRISDKLNLARNALDLNFNILDERMDFAMNQTSSLVKVIKPLSSDITRSIQELLAILGYATGKIDGILGRLTIAAIKAFQEEVKLAVNGLPSEDLLITLQTSVRKERQNIQFQQEPIKLPIRGTGTGFYIQEDILVTNEHVINDCNYISTEDGSKLSIETQDSVNDIAILNTSLISESILPLSTNPSLGQQVYAGGFPYKNILRNFNFTSGNISSLFGPGSNISEFQFTAPIQPGSSGGAILNGNGGVIGITVSTASVSLMVDTKSIPQNINFGIKVQVLRDILEENEIDFRDGNNFWFKSSQEDIAELSKNTSVVINCHASK
jgi:S1-C subfamily serine protease